MTLITARHLAKTYADGTRALVDATFTITQGEFVAIMGPSGSGKSTLLHILGFLDPQSGGEYRFKGRTSSEMTPYELSRVRNKELGFVFQQFNLLPRESVLDNIVLPLYYSHVPGAEWQERAQKAAEAVGLGHRLHHDTFLLSGGEKQRVAIARALINDPELIFADEPTGNLDSVAGQSIMEIMSGLNHAGHTVVLITHDEAIARHAKRVLTIRDGQLVGDETRS